MRVRATEMGYLNGVTYLAGDEFDVSPEFFADINDPDARKAKFGWMEKIEPQVQTAQETPAPTQDAGQ